MTKGILELQIDTEPQGAVFNEDHTHRLYLWRRWDRSKPWLMFDLLNPSKADGRINDPTVRRCIGFAAGWGYGGIFMFNAYTLISTDPKKLNTERPLVMGADLAARVARQRCKLAVAGWGNMIMQVRGWEDRIERIKHDLAPLHCLGLTRQGHPKHPVRLPYNSELISYTER